MAHKGKGNTERTDGKYLLYFVLFEIISVEHTIYKNILRMDVERLVGLQYDRVREKC